MENVVEQCFGGAARKGLVKKVAKSVEFLRGEMVRFFGVWAVDVLVEK